VRQDFDIRPLSDALGAEVSGLDLSAPLSDGDFARLHRAHLAHHVLVFRDQRITPAQQVAFSARWGPLQRHVLHQFALPEQPEVLIVSNIVENGRPIGLGDAGVFWHSDLSYKDKPSLGSFLHAQELPAEGGDTLFANQHLAWDELPAELARAVQGRRAEHSYLKVYAELQRRSPWRPDLSPEQIAAVPTVSQPIVRTHPETAARRCSSASTSPPAWWACPTARARRFCRPCTPTARRTATSTATAGCRATWCSGTTARCCTWPRVARPTSAAASTAPPSKATRLSDFSDLHLQDLS